MRSIFLNLFLIGLCLSVTMTSAEAAVSRKLADSVGYDSLDKAAVAALKLVINTGRSSRYEYGGCLYKADGRYHYTTPVTDREETQFSASCELSESDQFVGLYHNHPRGSEVGFSGHDINVANKYRATSYILIHERLTQEIVRYAPGRTRLYCPVFRGEVDDDKVCARGDLVTRLN